MPVYGVPHQRGRATKLLRSRLARREVGPGLVGRGVADRWAAGVFALVLIACVVWLLVGAGIDPLPTEAATSKTTRQVILNGRSASQRTDTTETTTADVPLSVWERLLGRRIVLLLALAIALLGAFLAAASVQRVLLGHYAFTLGPLAVPEITADQVSQAAEEVARVTTAAALPTAELLPEPAWLQVDDPNLALAG